jgi:hypothetical protein
MQWSAKLAPTQQVGVRLPPDVLAWLRRRGQENVRSMAAEIVVLVRAEMAREQRAKKRKAAS